jgi:hypothetical protein
MGASLGILGASSSQGFCAYVEPSIAVVSNACTMDLCQTEVSSKALYLILNVLFREIYGRVDQPGMIATLASWRSRVQIPARPRHNIRNAFRLGILIVDCSKTAWILDRARDLAEGHTLKMIGWAVRRNSTGGQILMLEDTCFHACRNKFSLDRIRNRKCTPWT